MDVFEELRRATLRAQEENELPDFLAERIFGIADRPERYRGLEPEISGLIDQLSTYDTYGQTGYLGMGVNNAILEGTLRRLEERAAPPEL